MILVEKGSPDQCVFTGIQDLMEGRAVPLTIQKGGVVIGICKKYYEEKRAGSWRYIESSAGNEKDAVHVKLVDDKFLMLQYPYSCAGCGDVTNGDMTLDVSFWKMVSGNTVNFVGGTTSKDKTKQPGGGRDWTLDKDGTISAKHHPNLVLGIRGLGVGQPEKIIPRQPSLVEVIGQPE